MIFINPNISSKCAKRDLKEIPKAFCQIFAYTWESCNCPWGLADLSPAQHGVGSGCYQMHLDFEGNALDNILDENNNEIRNRHLEWKDATRNGSQNLIPYFNSS
jgi:hypothetical protein